jgi:hypothetical protein
MAVGERKRHMGKGGEGVEGGRGGTRCAQSLFWVGKLQQSKVGGGAKARLQSRRDCCGAAAQGAAEAAAHGDDDDEVEGGGARAASAPKFKKCEVGSSEQGIWSGFATKFKKITFEVD